jgi:hypothetical protein
MHRVCRARAYEPNGRTAMEQVEHVGPISSEGRVVGYMKK